MVLTEHQRGRSCHDLGSSCFFSPDNDSHKGRIALIGDSDAASMAVALVPMLVSLNYQVLLNTKGACPFYILGDAYTGNSEARAISNNDCTQKVQYARLDDIDQFSPDLIIHVGRLNSLLAKADVRGLKGDTKKLSHLNVEQFILNGQNKLSSIAPTIYVQSFPKVSRRFSPKQHVLDVVAGVTTAVEIENALAENPFRFKPSAAEVSHWNVIENLLGSENLFKTWKYICGDSNPNVCSGFDSNGIFYFDMTHPSDYAVNLFFDDLLRII